MDFIGPELYEGLERHSLTCFCGINAHEMHLGARVCLKILNNSAPFSRIFQSYSSENQLCTCQFCSYMLLTELWDKYLRADGSVDRKEEEVGKMGTSKGKYVHACGPLCRGGII